MRVTNCLLKGQTGPNLHLQYSNTGCGVFNLGFFEPKVEKIYVFFSTHFVPLISIMEPKIIAKINFKNSDFCKLLRPPISPILKFKKLCMYVDSYEKIFLDL